VIGPPTTLGQHGDGVSRWLDLGHLCLRQQRQLQRGT